jgi:hypothetical protein
MSIPVGIWKLIIIGLVLLLRRFECSQTKAGDIGDDDKTCYDFRTVFGRGDDEHGLPELMLSTCQLCHIFSFRIKPLHDEWQ